MRRGDVDLGAHLPLARLGDWRRRPWCRRPTCPCGRCAPATNSRLSSSVVLPVPLGPTKATLRTEVPAAIGFSLTGWTWPSRAGVHLAGAPWTTFAGVHVGSGGRPKATRKSPNCHEARLWACACSRASAAASQRCSAASIAALSSASRLISAAISSPGERIGRAVGEPGRERGALLGQALQLALGRVRRLAQRREAGAHRRPGAGVARGGGWPPLRRPTAVWSTPARAERGDSRRGRRRTAGRGRPRPARADRR